MSDKNTFLHHVAKDLMSRFGRDMSKVCVVFPNKRARLFLNEELLSLAHEPMWAPSYTTIEALFETMTGETVSETIPAISILYHVYAEIMGEKAESPDRFWGWGEIILSDFDDIDKHLVNAEALFLNAKQLNDMESLDFLTDNQRQVLEHFFGNFATEKRTSLQERFSELWKIMPALYHGLRKEMPEGVQPYHGALERKAVENKETLKVLEGGRIYCFVGFNMLSETEKKLMSYLQDKRQALFYWDYDVMYKDNRGFEAGDFIWQNLLQFPNTLHTKGIYDNISNQKEITFVATSTDSIATRYIPTWLRNNLTENERKTAVVLCNEGQLQPVLHAIPDMDAGDGCPQDINVTMGYGLKGTPIFSLVYALVTLQTEGWDEKRKRFRLPFIRSIKYHPYFQYIQNAGWDDRIVQTDIGALVKYLDRIVMSLADKLNEEECFDDVLLKESIYLTHKTLGQFYNMAQDATHPLNLQPTTLKRLLKRVLETQSIPFHGEPAKGLQVMGLLETRCLDFSNILMLNVEEGFIPKTGMENSMIPYTLRVGFGLTTVRHRIAVFAYYFYRLIQRADSVTFVFNENSSGNVRHEMSRFLRQIQAETDIPIKTLRLEAEQEIKTVSLECIPKTQEIMDLLHAKFNLLACDKAIALSPSSINRYLDCPMKFYLSSVCNIRVEQDPEEGVDARMMGNIFHNSAERIYREMLSHSTDHKTITRQMLSAYTKDGGILMQNIIDQVFFKEANVQEYRGENILIRGVIERYLFNLLKWDERHAPIIMLSMEEDHFMELDLEIEGQQLRIRTGGRVDRMDMISDSSGAQHVRIVDYKTGSHQDKPSSLAQLFTTNGNHAGYYLQTFLYTIAARRALERDIRMKPVLFYTALAGQPDYDPTLSIGSAGGRATEENEIPKGPVEDIRYYEHEFVSELKKVIAELFSSRIAFTKTDELNTCKYCDFKKLCNRQ